jgi:hypothetical protein
MGEKEYLRSIRPGQDRIRYHHLTEGKRVIKFLVQYETFIEGKWREIVRYDSAHGHPHKDVLHPDGSQDKEYFQGWSNAEVLTYGQEDIRKRWTEYRQAYIREMGK